MRISRIAPVFAVVLLAASCQSAQDNPKQTAGTIVGAGLGALAGSQIGSGTGQLAAVAIGTLAGAWAGSEVGSSLDKADKLQAQQAAQHSLENNRTGQTTTWHNPDTGHRGSVTPVETYENDSGRDCRVFETTIYVDGKEETGTGRACRQPDGTWQIAQ